MSAMPKSELPSFILSKSDPLTQEDNPPRGISKKWYLIGCAATLVILLAAMMFIYFNVIASPVKHSLEGIKVSSNSKSAGPKQVPNGTSVATMVGQYFREGLPVAVPLGLLLYAFLANVPLEPTVAPAQPKVPSEHKPKFEHHNEETPHKVQPGNQESLHKEQPANLPGTSHKGRPGNQESLHKEQPANLPGTSHKGRPENQESPPKKQPANLPGTSHKGRPENEVCLEDQESTTAKLPADLSQAQHEAKHENQESPTTKLPAAQLEENP